ncbi:hypothetical protein GNI_023800 [Gregarina niphandrodes]|uniref:GATA zinc finger protein n=1 Tax=Gregarina niphandrodes TaxID=110365 RepID=A0A023BBQ5_GRENI|nr:hypothetical protein GNI_023800 [Gregarina niphandrodes]EZG79920.1 hypothetical protein GNI_023800 [Gregarina niphandrodes]|eukprot:XP_011134365.1 hypothetical protein GNI_023800 [Gregarina niphandrodes]
MTEPLLDRILTEVLDDNYCESADLYIRSQLVTPAAVTSHTTFAPCCFTVIVNSRTSGQPRGIIRVDSSSPDARVRRPGNRHVDESERRSGLEKFGVDAANPLPEEGRAANHVPTQMRSVESPPGLSGVMDPVAATPLPATLFSPATRLSADLMSAGLDLPPGGLSLSPPPGLSPSSPPGGLSLSPPPGLSPSSPPGGVSLSGITTTGCDSSQLTCSTAFSSGSSRDGSEDPDDGDVFVPAAFGNRSCARCVSHETPQWRYIHKYRFCNACYMKVKRWFDTNRPGCKLPGRTRNMADIDLDCDRILFKAFDA